MSAIFGLTVFSHLIHKVGYLVLINIFTRDLVFSFSLFESWATEKYKNKGYRRYQSVIIKDVIPFQKYLILTSKYWDSDAISTIDIEQENI